MKPIETIKKMQQGRDVTIAAIGDSLTCGWLENKGYLDYLAEMLKEKYPQCKLIIINKGIPGDTASGGLNRLGKDILLQNPKPDAVFIQFALNDAYLGFSPSEFRKNIQEIIDRVKASLNSDIILITSIFLGFEMGGDVANIFYGILDKVAEKNMIPIVKVHDYWEKHINNKDHFRTFVQGDYVHPNEKGYKLMAEAIMEIF